MEQIKISLQGEQKYLTVREGKALEQKPPLVMDINGDIDTVKAFVSKRYAPLPEAIEGQSVGLIDINNLQMIDKDAAVVTFDKTNLSISLDVNPTDFYGVKVKGSMQISDELKPWFINESHLFTREALVKLIKFNKRFFSDAAKHEELLKAYQSLSLQSSSQLKAESDTRGNKDAQFTKKVDSSGVPAIFFLTMPIFKGQPAVKFQVEVCLDSSEASVAFWFESVELKEIQDNTVDKIFAEQKSLFADFVIINK